VFDWVVKMETLVSLMIIVIIARFVTALAGGKRNDSLFALARKF